MSVSSGFCKFFRFVKSLVTSSTSSTPFSMSSTALFKLSVTQETALNISVIKFVLTEQDSGVGGGPISPESSCRAHQSWKACYVNTVFAHLGEGQNTLDGFNCIIRF